MPHFACFTASHYALRDFRLHFIMLYYIDKTIIDGREQEYEYKLQGGSNECAHKTQWSMLVHTYVAIK